MTPNIEPSLQAWAFLQGHTYVDPFVVHESVHFNGHSYLLHPPGAALVMLPFVFMLGIGTAPIVQQWVSLFAGMASVFLSYRLTKNWALTCFYAFGTTILYESWMAASWDFILVLSTLPTFGVLLELRGRRRPWLIGLLGGAAALVRYDLMLALPFYFYWACFPPLQSTNGLLGHDLGDLSIAHLVYGIKSTTTTR